MRIDNARVRRQLSCGPAGHHDIADRTQTIVKPEPIKRMKTQFIGGLWMIDDGSGWRFATPAEIDGMAG